MRTKRDFLSVTDFTPAETRNLIERAKKSKSQSKVYVGGDTHKPLAGKTVAILFDKPSLRTRVSFQVGIQQL